MCANEPLMPDVMAPKAHRNNRSYVSSADLPSDSLRKNLAWWAVIQRTLKNHKLDCQNWVVGACPGQYGKTVVTCSFSITIQVLLLTALLTLDEALVLFFSMMWHAMVMKVD